MKSLANGSMTKDDQFVEYRDETKWHVRFLVFIFGVPFVFFLVVVFWSIFDFSGEAASALIQSVLSGEAERRGDFLGYLAVVLLTVGCSAGLLYGIMRGVVLRPDQVVTISATDQTVQISRSIPFRPTKTKAYPFNDNVGIQQKDRFKTQSEMPEIWLHLPEPEKPIKLVAIFDTVECGQELRKLSAMGLTVVR